MSRNPPHYRVTSMGYREIMGVMIPRGDVIDRLDWKTLQWVYVTTTAPCDGVDYVARNFGRGALGMERL